MLLSRLLLLVFVIIRVAVRRNVAVSFRQAQEFKSKENKPKPDMWTKLKILLEPVCRNLKVGLKQVIEMVFTVLQSDRSDDLIQGEVSVQV